MEHKNCAHHSEMGGNCHSPQKWDAIYWFSLVAIVFAYLLHLFHLSFGLEHLAHFNEKVFKLMNEMSWGIALSFLAVGVLSKVPREMVMTYFSSDRRWKGLLKSTLAGTLFDLCNHGILLLGMKIYERGASLGQTMAFLIASPWNSFSLTVILYTLVGGTLTFYFFLLSLLIALITGWIFDEFVERGWLPKNPNSFRGSEFQPQPFKINWSWALVLDVLQTGFRESKMILKWIFFGTVLSALLSTFLSPEIFTQYFGNSLRGLFSTLLAATGIEVCSEGSVPLAADLVNIAKAPGNAFVFLMAGVATDFTEFMAIRETTKSWKIAFLVPVLTVPQIVFWGYLLNTYLPLN